MKKPVIAFISLWMWLGHMAMAQPTPSPAIGPADAGIRLVEQAPQAEDRRNRFDLQVSTVVHFEVNSHALSPNAQALLASHAKYLKANPHRKVTLEGFTDPRASRAYNLALSKRRVESVRQYLLASGLSEAQIGAQEYYGPDNPTAHGTSTADYAKNRRVELRY